MSEIIKDTATPVEREAVKEPEKNAQKKPEDNKPIPLADLAKGTLELAYPITARDKEVKALKYDYNALSGWEYVEAMDGDRESRNAFVVSAKQALRLFAAAAAKLNADLDATDICRSLSLVDTQRAVQLSSLFLARAGRELGKVIYGE